MLNESSPHAQQETATPPSLSEAPQTDSSAHTPLTNPSPNEATQQEKNDLHNDKPGLDSLTQSDEVLQRGGHSKPATPEKGQLEQAVQVFQEALQHAYQTADAPQREELLSHARCQLMQHVQELTGQTVPLGNTCLLYTSPSPRDA